MNLPVLKSASFTRRGFLKGCAACAACAACPVTAPAVLAAEPSEKPKLRLVFTHISPERPTWPYQGYDYEGRKKQLLDQLTKDCPGVEFLPATAMNREDAARILVQDSEVDGYVVYMIGIWTGAPQVIAASRRPTLFVDDLYAGSGEFLIAYAAAKRQGLRVAGVSSTRFSDVTQAIRAFEVMKKLRSSVILDVTDRNPGTLASAITDTFGAVVRRIDSTEFNLAYENADKTEGARWAKQWIKDAHKVVEPSVEEIERSGRIYIGMTDLMKKYKSDAIAVDCLNLFYSNKMPSYPCLGFFQLNNDCKVGACEADLRSTVTMLTMAYLVGKPGYISDPVVDMSKSQIIYAHCVASNRVHGPNGPKSPYYIRDHSEDRKGASVRVLMPVNEMTTTLLFNPLTREVIFHQAKAVANIDDDKACRTKLAAEVKDVEKILNEWDRWGWHRVTFYGDLRQQVQTISSLMGFTIVNEG